MIDVSNCTNDELREIIDIVKRGSVNNSNFSKAIPE